MIMTSSPGISELSADWQTSWGATGGVFNCSTGTFDVGSLHYSDARIIRVAAFVQDQIFITRETFLEHEHDSPCAESESAQHRSSITIWGGVWVIILSQICEALNFRCQIYEAIDHNDSVEESPVLRDLLYERADVGMTTRLITMGRIKTGNFTVIPSPVYSQFSMLIHKRFLLSGDRSPTEFYLIYFTPEIWLLLVGTMTVVTLGLAVSYKLRQNGGGATWSNVLFQVGFGQLTFDFPGHFTSLRKAPPSTVCFVAVSLLFSVIITNAFSACIPSELTATSPAKVPFSTVEEFLESNFALYGSTAVRAVMLESNQPDIFRLGKRMTIWPSFLPHDIFQFMTRDTNQKEGYLVRNEDHTVLANYSCDFVKAIPAVQTCIASAFWFPKGREHLSSNFTTRVLESIQTGQVNSLVNYYTNYYVKSVFRRNHKVPEGCIPDMVSTAKIVRRRALGMDDLAMLFVAVVFVGMCGIFITVCELVYVRMQAKRKSRCRMFGTTPVEIIRAYAIS